MSSGFISEVEIEEKRRLRQEEWEKVRKPEEPIEAPEEQYDPRSLYDRLQEQKQKKDIEYEEAHKLKNMIKGLDDDEVEFLDLVDRSKIEAERRMFAEEAQEMQDFRSAVASLQERSLQDRINAEVKRPAAGAASSSAGNSGESRKSSQQRLLTGAVKRKNSECSSSQGTTEAKKTCKPTNGSNANNKDELEEKEDVKSNAGEKRKRNEVETEEPEQPNQLNRTAEPPLRCIGILPGMGYYHDSSDSEHSSNTDDEFNTLSGYDLCGRKLVRGAKAKSYR